jgi:hypothetical protein
LRALWGVSPVGVRVSLGALFLTESRRPSLVKTLGGLGLVEEAEKLR